MSKKPDSLFETVKRAGAEYLSRRLAKSILPDDFPEVERKRLIKAAAHELDLTMGMLRMRFIKAREAPPFNPAEYTAQWTKVLAACRVLQVKPPKNGQPVDLAKAQKNCKAQFKAYHPDINPGHDEEYKAAGEALSILETYNLSVLHKADAEGKL